MKDRRLGVSSKMVHVDGAKKTYDYDSFKIEVVFVNRETVQVNFSGIARLYHFPFLALRRFLFELIKSLIDEGYDEFEFDFLNLEFNSMSHQSDPSQSIYMVYDYLIRQKKGVSTTNLCEDMTKTLVLMGIPLDALVSRR